MAHQDSTPVITPATPGTPGACEHPKFPLHRHKRGVWAAKIKGHRRYFGKIADDPTGEKAWEWYKKERPFWHAGMNPREMAKEQGKVENPTSLYEVADRWVKFRESLLTTEDTDHRITHRTYDESRYSIRALGKALKILKLDVHMNPLAWLPSVWKDLRTKLGEVRFDKSERSVSPATKATRINNLHMMFSWAVENGHLSKLPNWGSYFTTVGADSKEEYRYDFQREHGDRVFELSTARLLLAAVDNAVEAEGRNRNNTSGFRGVYKRHDDRFEAQIVLKRGGKKVKVNLGVFGTAEKAAEAYRAAAADKGINVEHRMKVGSRMFAACCYLAANTGCYSKDIASLRFEDIDLGLGYVERKRSKNSELWQAALWPETVERIKEYLKYRPEPDRKHKHYNESWEELVFLSSTGQPVNLDTPSYDERGQYHHTNRKDILKAHMRKMLIDMGLKDKGVNFGAWRHTFESLAVSAIGCRKEDLVKFDALNRTSARRIPGSRQRYVHMRFDQLKPIAGTLREQLWPERVAEERKCEQEAQAAEQRKAETKMAVRSAEKAEGDLRLVS